MKQKFKHLKAHQLKQTSFSKASLLVFVLVFAGIGGYVLLRSQAASSTANIFVASNGSDTGSNCVRFATAQANPDPSGATLCATWDKAFHLAVGGDRIAIESGSYDYNNGEYFTNTNLSGSSRVTFFPDAGASIDFVGTHKIGASHVIEDGFDYGGNTKIGNSYAADLSFAPGTQKGLYACVDDVWIQNAFVRMAGIGAGMSNIHFINDTLDEWGWQLGETPDGVTGWNTTAIGGTGGVTCPDNTTSPPPATNIEFNHVKFGNSFPECQNTAVYGADPQSTCREPSHADCVHFYGPSIGVWIHNSYFDHCGFYMNLNVEQTYWVNGVNALKDALFENNFFGNEIGSDGWIQLIGKPTGSMTCDNVVFRNNTFGYGGSNALMVINCPPPSGQTSGGVQLYNNIFEKFASATNTGACATDAPTYAAWDHNLFVNGLTCGANASTGDPKYVNPADQPVSDPAYPWAVQAWTADFHITGGSAAIGKGLCNSTEAAATDYDGDSRPQDGSACDIGADEYVDTTPKANLWVDTDGGSCTRSATPAVYDTATACGSLDAAFAASLDGDTVLVKCGTYPAQTISTIRASGNVTFGSETDKCATFEADGAQVITIGNKVGYLTLKNFTINGLIKVDSFSGNANNNITIDNNDIDVGKKVDGPPIQYSAGSNLVISHNTIGPSCCGYNGGSGRSPEGIRIGKDNDLTANCQTQACEVTIEDNLIQYAVRNCQYWPSSGYGTCPDTTCTNAVGCHMDGMHIWGMDGGTITRNRLYGVECQGIYFENVNSSLNRNINVTNNAISTITGGCSNKGVYINAIGSTDNVDNGFAGTWNIAFNSGSSYIMGPNNCTSCQSGTTFNITGNNMELMVTNGTGNNAGCGASAWGAATVNFKYNVWRPGGSGSTNQACGATDILASTPPAFIKEAVPPDIGIDLHLASATTIANDFVPSATCTSVTTVDFDGDTRPQGTACDAGADEYSSSYTPPLTPGDLNADGHVNVLDLSMLLSHWQSTDTTADINASGKVDILDLSILLSHYGT